MRKWIETKVSCDKTLENGLVKKVTESYLVDAVSFTEAEARIVEEVTPLISGDFSVAAVKKSNISELFHNESNITDRWFKVKLNLITLDEKSGAEKKSSFYCLVQSSDIRAAIKRLDEGMKSTVDDYEIASIAETKIVDVFNYEASAAQ